VFEEAGNRTDNECVKQLPLTEIRYICWTHTHTHMQTCVVGKQLMIKCMHRSHTPRNMHTYSTVGFWSLWVYLDPFILECTNVNKRDLFSHLSLLHHKIEWRCLCRNADLDICE